MEDMELLENEVGEVSTETDTESNGEGQTEIRQDVEEVLDKAEYENEIVTVSGGDSVVNYDAEFATIIQEIVAQREELDTLQEYMEYNNQSIFEKPLEDYTVTESLLLITMVVVLFGVVIKLIGGIITCKI